MRKEKVSYRKREEREGKWKGKREGQKRTDRRKEVL